MRVEQWLQVSSRNHPASLFLSSLVHFIIHIFHGKKRKKGNKTYTRMHFIEPSPLKKIFVFVAAFVLQFTIALCFHLCYSIRLCKIYANKPLACSVSQNRSRIIFDLESLWQHVVKCIAIISSHVKQIHSAFNQCSYTSNAISALPKFHFNE